MHNLQNFNHLRHHTASVAVASPPAIQSSCSVMSDLSNTSDWSKRSDNNINMINTTKSIARRPIIRISDIARQTINNLPSSIQQDNNHSQKQACHDQHDQSHQLHQTQRCESEPQTQQLPLSQFESEPQLRSDELMSNDKINHHTKAIKTSNSSRSSIEIDANHPKAQSHQVLQ